MRTWHLPILLFVFLLNPQQSNAELSKCNGVWTNKPCPAANAPALAESKPTPRPQADIDAGKKKLLITNLDTLRLKVRNQHGIDVGISAERSLCLSAESSVADCEKAIQQKEKYIDERVLAAAQLKAAQASSSSVPSQTQDNTQITIIQQRTDQIIVPRLHPTRRPIDIDDHPRGRHEEDRPRIIDYPRRAPRAPTEVPSRAAVDRMLGPGKR